MGIVVKILKGTSNNSEICTILCELYVSFAFFAVKKRFHRKEKRLCQRFGDPPVCLGYNAAVPY